MGSNVLPKFYSILQNDSLSWIGNIMLHTRVEHSAHCLTLLFETSFLTLVLDCVMDESHMAEP